MTEYELSGLASIPGSSKCLFLLSCCKSHPKIDPIGIGGFLPSKDGRSGVLIFFSFWFHG